MGNTTQSLVRLDQKRFIMMGPLLFLTLLVPSNLILMPSKDCFKVNTIYNRGHAIAQKTLSGTYECQEWCALVRRCTHFSFSSATHTCFLRTGDRAEPKQGFISGPKECQPDRTEEDEVCKGNVCLGGRGSGNSGNVMVDGHPVCDDEWGLEDAAVVCRQLGFPGVERATKESEFGSVSSSFRMDNVRCRGNETDLTDCYHKTGDDCDGTEAAGVVCAEDGLDIPDDCREEDKLCLVGGTSVSGNVYYGGHPVCHNGWDFPDANVVCRALGFSGATNFTIRSHFGLSNTFFSMSSVECRGDEGRLLECPHSVDMEECQADTVAGVACVGSHEPHWSLGGYLGVIVGVILAFLIIFVAGGIVLAWKRRNKKLKSLQKSSIVLPKISFKNPIINEDTNADPQLLF